MCFMPCLFTLTARVDNLFARSVFLRCKKLIQPIRRAHFYFFGLDFPYWYSVAQAEVESACRHRVKSLDGIGSVGFAQITWRWWKRRLQEAGIPEIASINNHAKAQAYILFTEWRHCWCRRLFEMYQRYNGGPWVTKELKRAKSCSWKAGYRACRRRKICVWRTKYGCKQWRSACDINYEYSKKIFFKAQKYRAGTDSNSFPFW